MKERRQRRSQSSDTAFALEQVGKEAALVFDGAAADLTSGETLARRPMTETALDGTDEPSEVGNLNAGVVDRKKCMRFVQDRRNRFPFSVASLDPAEDVLFGKGIQQANVHYLRIVHSYRARFEGASTQTENRGILAEVFESLRDKDLRMMITEVEGGCMYIRMRIDLARKKVYDYVRARRLTKLFLKSHFSHWTCADCNKSSSS